MTGVTGVTGTTAATGGTSQDHTSNQKGSAIAMKGSALPANKLILQQQNAVNQNKILDQNTAMAGSAGLNPQSKTIFNSF